MKFFPLVCLASCCASGRKTEEIDESVLPEMKIFLESVNLTQFLPFLEEKGYDRTRQFLRWGKSDVQLLASELNLSKEARDLIHQRIEELKYAATNTCKSANEEDEGAETRRARNELSYGRLTATRTTTFFDYKRAWFGKSLPYDYLPLVRADPPDACGPPLDEYSGRAVLADRGGCTFLDKAKHASTGSVLIVVNAQGFPLDRPASGHANNESSSANATEVDVAVVLVEAAAGVALEKAQDVRFVPLKCVAGDAECKPILREDERVTSADSGFVNGEYEFVSAAWGAYLPKGPRPLVVSPPDNLCTKIDWLGRLFRPKIRAFSVAAEDAVVLAKRGGCPFGVKAENAARLKSAALIIVQSGDEALVRMGSISPPGLPTVMVETGAGEALEASAGKNVTFEPGHFASRWLELGEASPLDRAQLSRLKERNRDSEARLAWLDRRSN